MLPAVGSRLGTLRRRLFLLLASASVIAVVGVNLIWLPGTLRDVRTARGELELVAVRGVRDQIDFFLADKEEALTTIAQLFRAAVIDGGPKGAAIVGQRFLAREHAFEEVGIFEPPRTWRYRLSRREVMTLASSDAPPALDGPLQTAGVTWGAVTTTETSEPWVTIAAPLTGSAESRLLVIGVLNLKDLWSLIADLRLGQGGRAYVVDRRGGLIAADDANLVLKRLSVINRPIVRGLLEFERPIGVTGSYTNERGIESMATGLRVERAGWGVVVEHPRAVVSAAVGQKLWFFAALTIGGVLVSAGAAHVLSARLTRPLERLRQGVQRFGRGELDHRVPIESPDEIGELALQFNQMATELGASHARLEERIRDATRDLARRQREAEELARVARTLTEDLDMHQVADRVVQPVLKLFGVQSSVLWLREPDGSLVAVGISGRARESFRRGDVLPAGASIAGRAVAQGRPAWTRDVLAEPGLVMPADQRIRLRAAGDRAVLCVPMAVSGRTIGVLALGDGSARDFTPDEVVLLQAFGDQAAIALQNASLYAESQTQRIQLTQILESTSDGVLFVGPDGRVQAANRHAGELLGRVAASIVGEDLGEILSRGCSAASTENLLLLCAGGLGATPDVGVNGDLEMPSLNRVLHWEGRATRDAAGRTTGLTITVHDVTQDREIAQMKSDFVSFATHQLRTPLSGIKWMLELAMQETAVPESATSYMKDALGASQRLIQLVNDLLDVSRLESGRMKASPQLVDLLGLTRGVLDDLKLQLEEKDQRLTLETCVDRLEVFADPQLLRQVVLNLASNAIKYSPSRASISVRLTGEGHAVRWQITDTGIGIPKESQRHLFEKFYRADNVAALETDGTGLGLYLVRLIVEQSGGRVGCESEEGQGATFYFTVPGAQPSSPAAPLG
ncbi:MAG TPA: ATP-binding protein [Methylomirabilota bacterium]|nr:ATP-binding protein [Methylomirabilota bacterium]